MTRFTLGKPECSLLPVLCPPPLSDATPTNYISAKTRHPILSSLPLGQQANELWFCRPYCPQLLCEPKQDQTEDDIRRIFGSWKG